MTGEGVEVSGSSIERAWKASGYDDFWLKVKTGQPDPLAAVRSAAIEADDASVRGGAEVGALTIGPCPGGVAVEIGPGFEREQIHRWVRYFAEALRRHGIVGQLGGAVQPRTPRILGAEQEPTPTLFARFGSPTRNDPNNPGWAIEPAHTQRVVRAVLDWALAEPGRIILAQGAFSVEVNDLDLQAPMERGLHSAGSAGVDVVDEPAQRARHAHLGHVADGLFQSIGGSALGIVAELRDLATRLPPPLDVAFVRISHRGVAGINGIDRVQPLPDMRELHVRYSGHLLGRYLPDAHGIQVVTDAHLQAADDLSEWTITDLGQGRHLVTAHDLEPWYAAPLPEPATLARARAAWGAAILTQDVHYADRRG